MDSTKTPGNVVEQTDKAPVNIVQMEEKPPKKPPTPTRTSTLIPLGGKKFVTVRSYNGQMKLNIRKYINDIHGKMYSTKNGIMLTATEWRQLKKSVKDIDERLKSRQQLKKK